MDFMVVAPEQNDVLLRSQKLCDWEPIKNINDPHVQEMGRFAVMEHTRGLCGVGLTFIRVVSGETMTLLDKKEYRLVVEVKEVVITPCMPTSIKLYQAIVQEKQGDRSWKLLIFEPFVQLPYTGPGPVIQN